MGKDNKPALDDIDWDAKSPPKVQCPSCKSFATDYLEETHVCCACGKQWRIVDGKVVYGVWIK